MIPAGRDEISIPPAETSFTLGLHVEIKFRPGKAGQFTTWYLIRFTCIFFWFFILQNWRRFIDFHWFKFFYLSCLVPFHKIRSSRSQIFFTTGVLKNFAVFTGKHQRWSHFFIKLQTWRSAKRLQYRCFPVNIEKNFKNTFFAEHLRWLRL